MYTGVGALVGIAVLIVGFLLQMFFQAVPTLELNQPNI
jgi:hypothetical protein